MPLRPSQDDSMLHSCWTSKSASTQPVSWLAAEPLPQLSSEPDSTAWLVKSRQLMPERIGSVIVQVLLVGWLVSMLTGFGPL